MIVWQSGVSEPVHFMKFVMKLGYFNLYMFLFFSCQLFGECNLEIFTLPFSNHFENPQKFQIQGEKDSYNNNKSLSWSCIIIVHCWSLGCSRRPYIFQFVQNFFSIWEMVRKDKIQNFRTIGGD